MHVIATAGHVDHGKSTLLRALTGMEPDRWEEERRRGLTIDLGFVWSGDVAFVDVPGHERFITNMLAGVGPVPAVLFVVAADGGWCVQSREHLGILDALGIRHGVLVVTRSDLADPAPALAEAGAELAGTSLAGIPSVAVSAVTGSGLPRLRTLLTELGARLPGPDPHADVRLWADRVFTVAGRGTVVTGTLAAGTIRVGDALAVGGEQTSDGEVRVRGLQALRLPREQVCGPARVAINVRGPATAGLRRGAVLVTPGRWLSAPVFDVRLRPAADVPRQAVWHMGAAAVPAHVRVLGPDTARITLAAGLPLRIGDSALLRDPGSRRVWGVTVLDVRPPELRRRGAAERRAAELAATNGVPDGVAEVRRRKLVRRADLTAMGAAPPGPPVAGDWLADPLHWGELQARLVEIVAARAARHPDDPGLPAEVARQALDLPDPALVEALAAAVGLRRVRGRLAVAGPTLPPAMSRAVATLRAELDRAPFAAPGADRLAELGLNARTLAAAEAAGLLLRVAPGVVLAPDALERALQTLAELPQPFTTAQARQALTTTRRVVIPLLERLDRLGRTRRVSDSHREVLDR